MAMAPVAAMVGLLDNTVCLSRGDGLQNGGIAADRCGLGSAGCEAESKCKGYG
jgi:hypothetical protein